METETRTTINSETKGLRFGIWKMSEDGESGEFVPLDNLSEDEAQAIAPLLGLTALGVDTFNMLVEHIVEKVGGDLADIWKRLDAAGIE